MKKIIVKVNITLAIEESDLEEGETVESIKRDIENTFDPTDLSVGLTTPAIVEISVTEVEEL